MSQIESLCIVEPCAKPAINGRGWRWGHYTRWRRHGDPLLGGTPDHHPMSLRLKEKSRITESGCWEWLGHLNAQGYGVIGVGNRTELVYRVSHQEFIGPIGDGLQIDHLCRNKACLNPEHLEAVTRAENIRRWHAWRREQGLVWGDGREGEKNPMSKLTDLERQVIRDQYAAGGISQSDLAERFGVTQTTISRITKATEK